MFKSIKREPQINKNPHEVKKVDQILSNGIHFAGFYNASENQRNFPSTTTYDIKPGTQYTDCRFEQFYFTNVDFKNIIFTNCYFINCIFIDCKNFDMLVFENCDFSSCRFQNCSFFGKVLFQKCFLRHVLFINTILYESIFCRSCFYPVIFRDKCDISGAFFISPCGEMDINFVNENGYTKIDNRTYIGDFSYSDKHFSKKIKAIASFEPRFSGTKNGYLSFESQLVKNYLPQWHSNCFLNRKKAETRSASKFRKKAIGFLIELSSGYGEKPFYTIILGVFFVFIFANLYMLSGFKADNQDVRYIVDMSQGFNINQTIVDDFMKSMSFSFFTFITAGLGTIRPTTFWGEFLFNLELFLGVIFVAVFTSTLVRKMTR